MAPVHNINVEICVVCSVYWIALKDTKNFWLEKYLEGVESDKIQLINTKRSTKLRYFTIYPIGTPFIFVIDEISAFAINCNYFAKSCSNFSVFWFYNIDMIYFLAVFFCVLENKFELFITQLMSRTLWS